MSQFLNQLAFLVDVATVADKSTQPHAARLGELHNTFADVVGSIHSHHFAGTDNVDLFRLAFTDRHGKTAAHHVAQHIVENVVEVLVVFVGAKLLQKVDGGNDSSTSTTNAWLGAS